MSNFLNKGNRSITENGDLEISLNRGSIADFKEMDAEDRLFLV